MPMSLNPTDPATLAWLQQLTIEICQVLDDSLDKPLLTRQMTPEQAIMGYAAIHLALSVKLGQLEACLEHNEFDPLEVFSQWKAGYELGLKRGREQLAKNDRAAGQRSFDRQRRAAMIDERRKTLIGRGPRRRR